MFLSLKFKTVKSDSLFYDCYQYSVSVKIQEAWVFRYTNERDEIDSRLTRQQEWRDRMRARWPGDGMNRYHSPITDTVRLNSQLMGGFIRSISSDYKMVIEPKTLRFYTNDLNLLYDINRLGFVTEKKFSEAVINRPKNTILLKNPRHKYRSYFRETKISDHDKQVIAQFLKGQPGIRIGAGLTEWLKDDYIKYSSRYTREYFFVDHDSNSWLTMFALVRPGLIRKTVDIIAK